VQGALLKDQPKVEDVGGCSFINLATASSNEARNLAKISAGNVRRLFMMAVTMTNAARIL